MVLITKNDFNCTFADKKLSELFTRARTLDQIAKFERLRRLAEARIQDRNRLHKRREERISVRLIYVLFFDTHKYNWPAPVVFNVTSVFLRVSCWLSYVVIHEISVFVSFCLMLVLLWFIQCDECVSAYLMLVFLCCTRELWSLLL